ncbi:hypothetical protein HMPREF1640_09185 [Prevotella sp. S7-1-8]|uniref:hypothetical protein n=1 Tax=Prevotella sp. S7-1-8 TaxID=1284775 RepID=UPI00050D950B|nr:hypothetical protein [Prevotella sp. S7-1-8]KGF16664.1 hypothetical protein HMPREF1640_09185 [Prevotella sp. S7-1-8]
MTLVIVCILLLVYLLIDTENITKVNKAAVAIFVCAVAWALCIGYGADFLTRQHASEHANCLNGRVTDGRLVKMYVANNLFPKYVGRACEIVSFLLATMTTVKILENNGSLDFIAQLLKPRGGEKMPWRIGVVKETGMAIDLGLGGQTNGISSMLIGLGDGIVSAAHDDIVTAASYFALQSLPELNMAYLKMVAFTASVGRNLYTVGSVVGLVLMRMEKMRDSWHFGNIGWKAGRGTVGRYGCLAVASCIKFRC